MSAPDASAYLIVEICSFLEWLRQVGAGSGAKRGLASANCCRLELKGVYWLQGGCTARGGTLGFERVEAAAVGGAL